MLLLTITHHKSKTQIDNVFAISPLMSALSTPTQRHWKEEENSPKWPKAKEKLKPSHLNWAKLGLQSHGQKLDTTKQTPLALKKRQTGSTLLAKRKAQPKNTRPSRKRQRRKAPPRKMQSHKSVHSCHGDLSLALMSWWSLISPPFSRSDLSPFLKVFVISPPCWHMHLSSN
jgi:hypothetical protein